MNVEKQIKKLTKAADGYWAADNGADLLSSAASYANNTWESVPERVLAIYEEIAAYILAQGGELECDPFIEDALGGYDVDEVDLRNTMFDVVDVAFPFVVNLTDSKDAPEPTPSLSDLVNRWYAAKRAAKKAAKATAKKG